MAPRKTISVSDARRRFSELLRAVQAGETYVITRYRKEIAVMRPLLSPSTNQARDLLFARLQAQPVLNIGRWNRAELYE